MKKNAIHGYLLRSEFSDVQADTLSQILSDTATHDDLQHLAEKMDDMETRLRAETVQAMAELRTELVREMAELRTELSDLRGDVKSDIAEAQTRMMRWGIAALVGMSTIFTLLDIIID